jgi:hypothetical protein
MTLRLALRSIWYSRSESVWEGATTIESPNFVFDLFPAEQRRFDERLADEARVEPGIERLTKLLLVVNDAAAGASERIRGTYDERIAASLRERDAAFDIVDDRALGDGLADLEHLLLEAFAIFGELDRLHRRAEQFDGVTLENAGIVQLDRQIEPGLAAERRQECVGALAGHDLLDRLQRQGLEVDGVGDLGIGHDRRRVGVDEDDAVAFFAKRTARLHARIIELRGLTDDDRSRADDHHVPAGHARAMCLARAERRPSTGFDQGCKRVTRQVPPSARYS